MAIETFANESETTLASAITDGTVTSISVAANASFPQSGQFRIRIENELLLVTAGAGTNSWTATRGIESTNATSHSSTSKVIHVVTAGALAKFREDNILTGALGSRPSAGRTGALYIPDGGSIIQRDNGVLWDSFGPVSRLVPPPLASNFTFVNQGSATLTDSVGTLILQTPYNTGTSKRIVKKAAPSTPYTLTVAFRLMAKRSGTGRTAAGVTFRQSSDGKIYPLAFIMSGTSLPTLEIRAAASATDGSGSVVEAATILDVVGSLVWFRIADNGTNRISSLSVDGVNWVQFHSVGRTSYLTADEIGFFLDYDWNSDPKMQAQVQILSWDES